MNKKIIKALVLKSYKNNNLDNSRVVKIVSFLKKRKLIKMYLAELKREEKNRSIIISTPYPLSRQDYGYFSRVFPKKKIVIDRNPDLILGAEIRQNDLIYQFDLKNILKSITMHIKETYD